MVRIPKVLISSSIVNVNLHLFPYIRQISTVSLKQFYFFKSPLMLFCCEEESSTIREGFPSEESCPHDLAILTTADWARDGLLTRPPANEVVWFQNTDHG